MCKKQFKKKDSEHAVILIVLCQEGIVLRCYITFLSYKVLFLAESIRNRDLIEKWISDHTYCEEVLKFTQHYFSGEMIFFKYAFFL